MLKTKGNASILAGLVLSVISCNGGKSIEVPEIPVIQIGTGGVRASSLQGPPEERYRTVFDAMTKAHIVVRSNLGGNSIAISEGMEGIIRNLGLMKSMVTSPFSPRFDEYVLRYQDMYKSFKSKRYTTATVTQFDMTERELRKELDPELMQYVAEVPVQGRQEERPDRSGLPTQDGSIPLNPIQTPKGNDGDIPFWMVYKAWEQADRDLHEAYRKNAGGYESLFQRVRESLAMIKPRLSEADRPQFQYYLNEYERIFSATQGLNAVPEGATRDDVLADLKNVSSVVNKACNPDRK